MYPNLEAELKRRGVKRSDIADHIGCSISTISEKMQGKSDFSLQAAKKIKSFLGVDLPLEVLFKCDNIIPPAVS